MKHLTLIAAMAATVIGLSACSENKSNSTATTDSTKTTTATTTTTTPAEAPTPPMDSAAKMKAWMAYMTPGEPHKMLAASDGKWKTESTMWMEPGAPPQTGVGEAVNKMIMGGRYQRMNYKGTMMGQPFEGEGLTAYDNSKKMFVNTWIDNMGTGIMQMEGPWDDATKTMTLKGSCKDPITGKETTMREVYKIIDDKHHEMQMYSTVDGKEYKNMEMKMTKQ